MSESSSSSLSRGSFVDDYGDFDSHLENSSWFSDKRDTEDRELMKYYPYNDFSFGGPSTSAPFRSPINVEKSKRTGYDFIIQSRVAQFSPTSHMRYNLMVSLPCFCWLIFIVLLAIGFFLLYMFPGLDHPYQFFCYLALAFFAHGIGVVPGVMFLWKILILDDSTNRFSCWLLGVKKRRKSFQIRVDQSLTRMKIVKKRKTKKGNSNNNEEEEGVLTFKDFLNFVRKNKNYTIMKKRI